MGVSRWSDADVPRGADYDARWTALAAAGESIHGEADFVSSLEPTSVFDAGCGTGRVAIELARRRITTCGVDLDRPMLDEARRKAPDLRWVSGDLADPALDLGTTFDVVVAAGNVMIFVAPGTLGAVLGTCRRHLDIGGALVAGFSLRPGGLDLPAYDRAAVNAGFEGDGRWSTWDRRPAGGDYAVSLHRAV
jgi:SAM-dependent methyltransferase